MNTTDKTTELDDEDREIVNRLHEMIDDRLRITDNDFRIGLPADIETRIIERMTEAGYEIGMDEDGRNEWWPPEKDDAR